MRVHFLFTKWILLIIFSFLISACSNNDEEEMYISIVESKGSALDYCISYEEALAYVQSFFSTLEKGTRTNSHRVVSNYKIIDLRSLTRSNTTEPSGFYLFNFTNNNGFALVSTDRRTNSIYAYSLDGNINYEDACANSGFGVFMENAAHFYQKEIDSYSFSAPEHPLIPDTMDQSILRLIIEEYEGHNYYVEYGPNEIVNQEGPLISVKWEQLWPYNYYCGTNTSRSHGYRNAVGCGPLAAGQIMSYYQHPIYIHSQNLDWPSILSASSYNEAYTTSESISTGALKTAYLLHEIGLSSSAVYGYETSTTIANIARAFNDFCYSYKGPTSFGQDKVVSSIHNNQPVFASGKKSNGEGHGWVIDGVYNYQYKKTYYYTYYPHDKYKSEYINNPYKYYHCKWGSNTADTWCLNTFDSFNINNNIIYNIHP